MGEIKLNGLGYDTKPSYENNLKTLISHKVKILHETLRYRKEHCYGYMKEGVAYSIQKKLYVLKQYLCEYRG